MSAISRETPPRIDAEAEVVVIGAGACGLVAALRARAEGAEVVILEGDASPSGSTSMSSGFVPAPSTRFQRAIGVNDDSPERLEADIQAKSKGLSLPHLARLASHRIGPALEWLTDRHGIDWIVLDGFLYPGHSRHRMHAVAEMTGAALHARLLAAAQDADVTIVTEARANTLHIGEDSRVRAVTLERPDGAREVIGCTALVLACNGFGGNPELVARHIPEMTEGLYYGHIGNTGDALLWGAALSARLEHLSAYQGHGSLAHPHGILISWALMMEGGVQVNLAGQRFSNEHEGYSEQAVKVLSQPEGIAWNLYDRRLHDFAQSFPDYRIAQEAGAVREAEDIATLARVTGLPAHALGVTLEDVAACQAGVSQDSFGRDFTAKPALQAPYFAVKVTGALFHTQGGLVIDETARVLDSSGKDFPNLFAAGGAACGVSGPEVSGYLSGNGLLTAISFGFVAGAEAARSAAGKTSPAA